MSDIDKKQVWSDALESIKVSVSPAMFSTWFSQTHIVSTEVVGKRIVVTIGCGSSYVKNYLENRYFGLIQDSLGKTLSGPCDIVFTVKQTPIKKVEGNTPLFTEKKDTKEDELKNARIRKGFTFDNFAVSSSNQMAWAAAEAVSKNPGDTYNPLFLWGGTGVGKTHLMISVGRFVIKNFEEKKVLYCTAEEFTNDIVEGIRNKTTQKFRNKYRKLDVLLLDDIQFIAGKDSVQEEFFHTFNALTGEGGQIILTSDKTPSDIAKLEGRLKSRFEAGLIIDITPPDFELRCAIAQIKARERGIELSSNLAQLIAGNVDSARELQGFIIKLISQSKFRGMPIGEDLVEDIIGKGDREPKKFTAEDLLKAVCEHFSVGKREIMGKSRTKVIAEPRQILMYMMRTQLGLPYQEVGRLIGGRDHTTVMHAVNKITHLAKEDARIREDILGIKNKA